MYENEHDTFSVTDYGRDFTMFHCATAPSKPDYQNWVRKFKESDKKETKYFDWILSCNEEQINSTAIISVRKYNMPSHFVDIKLSIAQGILEAIDHYDFSAGKSFMQFKDYYVRKEILRYVRTMQTSFSITSERYYDDLRKAMAIYNDMGQKNDDETLMAIAKQVYPKKSVDKALTAIRALIEDGLCNMRQIPFKRLKSEYDDEETDFAQEIYSDESFEGYNFMYHKMRYQSIWAAYNELSERERRMIALNLGFCRKCHGTGMRVTDEDGTNEEVIPIKSVPYTVISDMLECFDPNMIKRDLRDAYRKMFEFMKKTDYFKNFPDDKLEQLKKEAEELQKEINLPPEKMRPFYAHLWEDKSL